MSFIYLFFIPSLFQADRLWCELALTSTPEAQRNCSPFLIEPRTAVALFISICKRMFCSSLARIFSILVREALLAANFVISSCVVVQYGVSVSLEAPETCFPSSSLCVVIYGLQIRGGKKNSICCRSCCCWR